MTVCLENGKRKNRMMRCGNTPRVKNFCLYFFTPGTGGGGVFPDSLSFFDVRGEIMAVKVKKLKKQLLSKIDQTDLMQVEKVERYINLVELFNNLDEDINKHGTMIEIINGSKVEDTPKPIVPYPGIVLKEGAKGMKAIDIKRVQRAAGMPKKDEDGKYGPKTTKAVKVYQN